MGLSNKKTDLGNTLTSLLELLFETGYTEGYDTGYDDGYEDGYKKRKEEDMAAISDGLRKGSSECAKILSKY